MSNLLVMWRYIKSSHGVIAMNNAKIIVDKFGGQSALAKLIGKGQSTVQYWAHTGIIPARWQPELLRLAKENNIDLIPSDFMPEPTTINTNNNSKLSVVAHPKPINPRQQTLDLGISKQIEIDGVGMGVLSNGIPFLTGRGLARICGISNSVIVDIGNEWNEELQKPRITRLKEILNDRGEYFDSPYIKVDLRSGSYYVYSDLVCLAVLEYYAFDAGTNVKEQARKNYRLLAGKALREFIYTQVGYDPDNSVPDAWRQFHDRVSLTYNAIPNGYFGIFKEISDMVVTLGQAGLHIDSSFVPDISIGLSWGKYWTDNDFDNKFSERIKWDHNYPNYFPQSRSNPQPVWCYPDAALGEFRRWMRETYIGDGKFMQYLNNKVAQKMLPPSFAQLAVSAYTEQES